MNSSQQSEPRVPAPQRAIARRLLLGSLLVSLLGFIASVGIAALPAPALHSVAMRFFPLLIPVVAALGIAALVSSFIALIRGFRTRSARKSSAIDLGASLALIAFLPAAVLATMTVTSLIGGIAGR